MYDYCHLHVVRNEWGVVTVSLDVAGRSVNVLDGSVVGELSQIVHEVANDASVRMLVLRSAKEKGFAAGADLAEVQALATPDEAVRFMEQGRRLGMQLESLNIPTVALIHGACLGGGLELTMYCRLRIARDDARTSLGLPETKLGLIPGWGGTWLLPRLVGPRRGLPMILAAESVGARESARIGLVHHAVAPDRFEETVDRLIEGWRAGTGFPRPAPTRATIRQRLTARWQNRIEQRRYRRGAQDNPAILAARRAVLAGILHGRDAGLEVEQHEFCRILFDPRSRALLERFFEHRKH
jgi:enoyl-CoA hydratase/carnithine racemase